MVPVAPVGEAPEDGTSYVRQDGGWATLPAGGGAASLSDLTDTPATFGSDGQLLAVAAGGASAVWIDPPSGGGLADASIDGMLYGRQDGAWVSVTVSGTVDWSGLTGVPATIAAVPEAFGTAGQLLAVTPAGDGLEWINAPSGTGGGSIADAPEDGELYVRHDGAWAPMPAPEHLIERTAHRYWRIYITANNGSEHFTVAAGAEMRGADGTNLVGTGTAIASSIGSASAAPEAFVPWDGDTSDDSHSGLSG